MKKTIKRVFNQETLNYKNLAGLMFDTKYWKAIDRNSSSKKEAIENTIYCGRKAVRTASSISVALGLLAGGFLSEIIE